MLENAGLHPVCLITTGKLNNPTGSGPGGMVRFGDAMLPSRYRIVVPKREVTEAKTAMRKHHLACDEWLFNGGAMPEACK